MAEGRTDLRQCPGTPCHRSHMWAQTVPTFHVVQSVTQHLEHGHVERVAECGVVEISARVGLWRNRDTWLHHGNSRTSFCLLGWGPAEYYIPDVALERWSHRLSWFTIWNSWIPLLPLLSIRQRKTKDSGCSEMPVGGHHCTLQTSTYCSYGKNHPPLTENSPSLAVLQDLEKEKDSQAAVRPLWGDRFKRSSTEQALRGRLCGHYGDTKLKADWQPVTPVPTHKLFLFSLRTGSHQADLRMVTQTDVPLSRWLRLRPRIWEQAPRRSSSPVRGNKTSWGTWWTRRDRDAGSL